NVPPTAEANGPYTVAEGGSITLASGGSTDPDGSLVAYEWDFNYDGVTFDVDATGPAPTFSAVGLDGLSTRTVALRVRDNRGATALDTAAVTITDVPPTITLSGAATVNEGTPYALTLGAVTDPGQDTVTGYLI